MNEIPLPELTPRPVKNRRGEKIPDHARIYRLVKADPRKPLYALSLRNGTYFMIFYDRSGRTGQLNLYTDDPVQARARRDTLYKKCESLGKGAQSKLEGYAEEILRNPKTLHGLKFLVFFGGHTISCRTHEEQIQTRARLAKELLERKRAERKLKVKVRSPNNFIRAKAAKYQELSAAVDREA